ERLKLTEAAIGGDAARATQQFLALFGAKTGPQGL
ncbi:TetR/AcrR family transcriptional regulator, partial [Mesorhizobium sp. M7A.F.Ca.CA.004.04.1.1]